MKTNYDGITSELLTLAEEFVTLLDAAHAQKVVIPAAVVKKAEKT